MYDVYVNNNNKKKLIIIGGAVIGVILIGFFVFFLLSGDGKEKNLKDFYAKINNQKYDEMYAMISDDAKSTYTKELLVVNGKEINFKLSLVNMLVMYTRSSVRKLDLRLKRLLRKMLMCQRKS